MNTKQIGILVALVVVVGFGGLWFKQRKDATWVGGTATGGQKLLANLPVGENLAHILIRQGTNELNLIKQDDRWQVRERGGYPADYSALSSAILKLRDLKAVQTETVGASQLGRLELLPPGSGANTAALVEFRDASGKVLESLWLGKAQNRKDTQPGPMGDMGGGFPVGRWVMTGGATNTAVLVSDPLSNLAPQPQSWLSKDFIKVEKIKAISVTHSEATNSWSVSRETDSGGDWKLADAKEGESLDSSKTSGFGWALSSPSFADVAVSVDGLGLDKPTTLRVETFDGFTYNLRVGTKSGDNLPLAIAVSGNYPKARPPGADEKPEDKTRLDQEFATNLKKLDDKLAAEKGLEKWTYLVSSWTLDSLMKNRSELLAGPKTAEASEAPPETAPTEPQLLDLPPAN